MSKTRQTKRFAKRVGNAALSSYVPSFFRIHLRYIRNYPIVWAAFFVAPFIAIKMSLVRLFGWLGTGTSIGLGYDIMAIFVVALGFYMAERSEAFRHYYIYLAPAVIFISLIYAASGLGLMNPGFWAVGILIWLLSAAVLKITRGKGAHALAHGGDRKYAKARALYDAGDYQQAVPMLEKAAKGGHFLVLHLMGECYEKGHYFKPDIFKAARLYQRAAKKGYSPALTRFKNIHDGLSPEDQERLETSMLQNWLDE